MKPEIDQILGTTAGQIMMELAPQMPPGYSQATAGLLGIILGFCAQEYENGADIRAGENARMRNLLSGLESVTSDSKLKVKLGAVLGERDATLKISDLNAANAELKKVLIETQAHFEMRQDDAAKQARQEIWTLLRALADRRFLKLPGT